MRSHPRHADRLLTSNPLRKDTVSWIVVGCDGSMPWIKNVRNASAEVLGSL
jgi:hypothetical protein